MRQIAAVLNRSGETREPTRHCESDGCGAYTRQRKPYCPDHIMEGHYVSRLSKIVEDAIAEVEAVATKGARAIDLRGLVVEEALNGIAEAGEITWPRLVKDKITYLNNTDPNIGKVYLGVLKKHNLVRTRLNVRRDVQVVSLTDKGLRHVKG